MNKPTYEELAAENEKLKHAISEGGFEFALARTSLDIQRDIDLHDLRAANAELVEALKGIELEIAHDHVDGSIQIIIEALAKHGGGAK